jgi:branched-subunit amino acid aminotransferase/4-amino-4-deoxychorismate lyase
MADALAMVDGVLSALADARLPAADPAILLGWSVFETLAAHDGVALALEEHLRRLHASATAALVPWPGDALLRQEIATLLAAAPGDRRLRLTLTRGGSRMLFALPADRGRRHQPMRCARGAHRDEPFLGGRTKHASRAPWAVAVARAGVDDVLLVDADGRFTEGTTCGVLAVIDGVLWTAPDDGRILASTMVEEILLRAARAGVAVRREGPPANGPWDALYVASSTRDLAPVVALDGVPLPGWDPVGRSLLPPEGC